MLQESAPAPAARHPVPRARGNKPRRGTPAIVALRGTPDLQPEAVVEIDMDDLVFRVVAAFRRHPHVNNVLTHISRADWRAVEQAIRAILDPGSLARDLSPLACNIVDLMCADRGVTGRILKPYYQELLGVMLGEAVAARFIAHAGCLHLECEAAVNARLAAEVKARAEAALAKAAEAA